MIKKYVLTESEFQEFAGMLQEAAKPFREFARLYPFDAVACLLDRQYGFYGWQNKTLRRRAGTQRARELYQKCYFYQGRVF